MRTPITAPNPRRRQMRPPLSTRHGFPSSPPPSTRGATTPEPRTGNRDSRVQGGVLLRARTPQARMCALLQPGHWTRLGPRPRGYVCPAVPVGHEQPSRDQKPHQPSSAWPHRIASARSRPRCEFLHPTPNQPRGSATATITDGCAPPPRRLLAAPHTGVGDACGWQVGEMLGRSGRGGSTMCFAPGPFAGLAPRAQGATYLLVPRR